MMRPQVRLRLRDGHAGFETPQEMNLVFSFHVLAAMEDVRQIDIRAAPHESLRHHADHGAHSCR